MKIYPSLPVLYPERISAFLAAYESHVPGFHIDIMDGCAVHDQFQWSEGMERVMNQYAPRSARWYHLMVCDVRVAWKELRFPDVTRVHLVTVQYESVSHDDIAWLNEQIRSLKDSCQIQFGIAYAPGTDSSVIQRAPVDLDHVLCMTVTPGKSGQQLHPDAITLCDRIIQVRAALNASWRIGVDGAISPATIGLFSPVIDLCAVGSFLLHHMDTPEKAIASILAARDTARQY